MYALLWRTLPGPRWAKALQCAAMAGLITWALLTWVFPWVEPLLPFDQIIIGVE